MANRTSIKVSNIIAGLIAAFHVFCFQGHITDRITPAFHAAVISSIPRFNEKLFWFLGWTDEQLSLFMLAVNVLNISSLISTSTRTLGLLLNAAFFTLGLFGQFKTGEAVMPHLVLISMSAAAAWLRN